MPSSSPTPAYVARYFELLFYGGSLGLLYQRACILLHEMVWLRCGLSLFLSLFDQNRIIEANLEFDFLYLFEK